MNQERLKQFIAAMYRARDNDSIRMMYFQDAVEGYAVVSSEDELHTCGNKADAVGYLAISPEWREAGGSMSSCGCPIFDYSYDESALMKFLECSMWTADSIVHGDLVDGNISSYYDKHWCDVVAQDVIDKLEGYLL